MVTLTYQVEKEFEPQIVPEGLAEFMGISEHSMGGTYMGKGIRTGSHSASYPLYEKIEEGYLLKDFVNVRMVTRGTFSTEAAIRDVTEDPEMKEFLDKANSLFSFFA